MNWDQKMNNIKDFKVYIILILLIFINVEIKSEETRMTKKTTEKELIVDHIMFPVYNNDSFLDEMKKIWEEKGVGEIIKADYDAYSAVFFKTKKFYVEYLSTNKGEYNNK